MTARAKYEARARAVDSLVCVGLDPEIEKVPKHFRSDELPLFGFNRWVIEQTHEYAAAYKPNAAFYEARGVLGLQELEATIAYLRKEHPDVYTICDAKRGDIGNTNRGYVTAVFDRMGFDAITLHPYLGEEALLPFFAREDKASIVLCRTSNPGAGEVQDLDVDGEPLWSRIAERAAKVWNKRGNVMLVVGATYPEEMRRVRELAPEMTLLVPGIGAQGGDVRAVVEAGLDERGLGLMIASSRGILYSGDPAGAARELRDEVRAACEVTLASH